MHALLYWSWVPGFELLYALVQCTIMLTPRVLHFAARLSVIYAFGRAALFVCPTCGDDHAFPTDRFKVLLKGWSLRQYAYLKQFVMENCSNKLLTPVKGTASKFTSKKIVS